MEKSRKCSLRPQALYHFVLQPGVKAWGPQKVKVNNVAGLWIQVSFVHIHSPPPPSTLFLLPDFCGSRICTPTPTTKD